MSQVGLLNPLQNVVQSLDNKYRPRAEQEADDQMSVDNKSNDDEPPLRPIRAPFSSIVGGPTYMINTSGDDRHLSGSKRRQKMLDKEQAGYR